MMSARRGIAVLAAVGIVTALLAVGCGPKPPCPVAPSVVKDAQAKTATAETALSQAQTERSALEKELAEKQARLKSLEGQPEKLEKQLDNLKKGSGR